MLVVSLAPHQQSGHLSQGSQIESLIAPQVSLLCHTPWSRHAFFIVRVFSTVGEAGPVEAQELGSVGPTPTSRIGGRPFESVPLWQKKKN